MRVYLRVLGGRIKSNMAKDTKNGQNWIKLWSILLHSQNTKLKPLPSKTNQQKKKQ